MCSECRIEDAPAAARVPPSPKRKRVEDAEMQDVEHVARRRRPTPEEDSYGGDDEHGLGAAEEELPSPMPFSTPAHTSSRSTASPRLPPIASWLPHPYVDPSSLMGAAASKTGHPATRSPQNAQLPSPPPSGRFRPAITLANMPALTLPGPAHPLGPSQSQSQSQSQMSMPPPRQQHRKSVSRSPTVSPMWTPEDESAASLLLQISSKPRSSSVSSASGSSGASSLPRNILPMTPVDEDPRDRASVRSVEVATPGSLLGMRD
ncbi:hypothetical protein K466DRAFT_584097 [Polyporus arcularius HHB13444]|uniref:Uncharacterized protein n=1 Tax=Polyporus arcularius HHB13444 TaxID=1314778 RepID=A0A5C3PJM0_9APHY|nr:hypothetical protein K466DRAFT_584097 [Polyporus arcularius HHB13444]